MSVFLLGAAVTLAIKGQNPQQGPNMQSWLQDIKEGGIPQGMWDLL